MAAAEWRRQQLEVPCCAHKSSSFSHAFSLSLEYINSSVSLPLPDAPALSRGYAARILTMTANSPALQKAIEAARESFARLSTGDTDGSVIFEECRSGEKSILDIVGEAEESFKAKKSTKFLRKFQECTAGVQNLSTVIDLAVQAKADFICPIWAPIRFVLQVSEDHARAVEQIVLMLETISEFMGRSELYEKLGPDPDVDAALLRLFTDIVDYSIRAVQYFGRRSLKRVAVLIAKPYKHEFAKMREQIRDHTSEIHRLAVAKELLRISQAREEERMARCQKWLRPCAAKDVYERHTNDRLAGTCEWIQTNKKFLEWKITDSKAAATRILRISGAPGCGKSVLASKIFEDMQAEGQFALYFPFSSTDARRRSADAVARSFIAWSLNRAAKDGLDAAHALMESDQHPSTGELWETCGAILNMVPASTCCILDGVDEVTDGGIEVLERMCRLLYQCPVKCVVLGRSKAFEHAPPEITSARLHIHMDQDLTNFDINAFVDAEVSQISILQAPGLTDLATSVLKDNCGNMFLWVKLMSDDLRRSRSEYEINERLHNLPKGLSAAYRLTFARLKDRLDEVDRQLVQNVLGFVITARRSLTVEEITYAHALQIRSASSYFESDICKFLLREPENSIISTCGDLVNITGGYVHLNHSSIADFLARDSEQWTGKDDYDLECFRIDVPKTHSLFSSVCIDYLTLGDYGHPAKYFGTLAALRKTHPFIEYASSHCLYHVNNSSHSEFPDALDKLKALLDSPRATSWMEHMTVLWNDDAYDASLVDDLNQFNDRASLQRNWGEFSASLSARIGQEVMPLLEGLRGQPLPLLPAAPTDPHFPGQEGEEYSAELTDWGCLPPADSAALWALNPSPAYLTRSSRRDRNNRAHPPTTTAATDASDALLHHLPNTSIQLTAFLGHLTPFLRTPQRRLLDPLTHLFALIHTHAPSFPPYALLGIARFYCSVGKHAEALSLLLSAVVPRVEGSGTHVESLAYHTVGWVLGDGQQRHADAIPWLRRAIEQGRQLPFVGGWSRDVLGTAYEGAGLFEEGFGYLEALAARDREAFGEGSAVFLQTEYCVGEMLGGLGRWEEGVRRLRGVAAAWGRKKGEGCGGALRAALEVGRQLFCLGRWREAVEWLRRRCEGHLLASWARGKRSWMHAHLHYWLGRAYDKLQQQAGDRATFLPLAIEAFGSAYEKSAAVKGRDHADTLDDLAWLALELWQARRFGEMLARARTWFEASKRVHGADGSDATDACIVVAMALEGLGRYEEAIETWKTLLSRDVSAYTVRGAPGDEDVREHVAKGLVELGRVEEACAFWKASAEELEERGYAEIAVDCLEGAIGLERVRFSADVERRLETQGWLCRLLEDLGWDDAALKVQKRVAKMSRRHFGARHPRTVVARFNLGVAFYRSYRDKEALGCLRDVRRILASLQEEPVMVVKLIRHICDALIELDRLGEALMEARKALRLYEDRDLPADQEEAEVWAKELEILRKLTRRLPGTIRACTKSIGCLRTVFVAASPRRVRSMTWG